MNLEQNKTIPRRFFKAMETDDKTTITQLLAPNFKAYHSGSMIPIHREELLNVISVLKEAFTDQKYTIVDQIAEGDKVTTRTTWEATHSGEFQGLPATGKRILISGIAISRIKDGQIVERWLETNQLGLLQQLGLAPPSAY